MQDSFPFDAPPFDCLTPEERALVRETVGPQRFAADEVLLAADAVPAVLHVIAGGHVTHREGGEVSAVFGPGALAGAHALLAGRAVGALVAADEVRAWALPAETLRRLMAGNARFAARLYADLALALDASSGRSPQREFVSLMMVRVKDAYIRRPFFVDGGLDLVSVCRELAAHGQTNALVRDGERLGIFTTTDLRDALLRPGGVASLAVRDVARFDLVEVEPDAELFDALLLMVRHRVHRLVVRSGDTILGVLTQLDLMSFVSNHSHIIALQIEQATGVEELRDAAARVDGLVAVMHRGGVKIELITAMVSELNTRLFAHLWSLIAPAELVANSCLLVMGSEGRGEQILKTDQDNALLLRDGFDFPGLTGVTARFSAELATLGYPRCPGDIMVTNPLWCQPLAGFRGAIREWLYGSDPEGPMRLAIFFDAASVAGDAALLREARAFLEAALHDDDAFLARFAAAADQFLEPGSWWSRVTGRRDEQPLDLKKFGTFPIVHGVRALALKHHVRAAGTAQRLRVLVERQRIDAGLARDLLEALHFLMALKLTHQLRQRELGQPAGNLVRPSDLSTLERDRFKDSLAIIKRFRAYLHQHFRLGAL